MFKVLELTCLHQLAQIGSAIHDDDKRDDVMTKQPSAFICTQPCNRPLKLSLILSPSLPPLLLLYLTNVLPPLSTSPLPHKLSPSPLYFSFTSQTFSLPPFLLLLFFCAGVTHSSSILRRVMERGKTEVERRRGVKGGRERELGTREQVIY
jgi:hypothetical protein